MKDAAEPKIIMSNPYNIRKYFAWPTVARLKNGKIAVGASGFRISHICPFGVAVMSVSDDEGETFSNPAPIIDTALDDRDTGLCPFSKSGLIFTSFNNTVHFQKKYMFDLTEEQTEFAHAYLNTVNQSEEKRDLGANFRVSSDNGITFGPIHKSPVTSPHGPIELSDGTILWVGRKFNNDSETVNDNDFIYACKIEPYSGKCEIISKIEPIVFKNKKLLSCEPYAAELSDGSIICHIRVQSNDRENPFFTIYQCKSFDKGKTFTKPVQILDNLGGAPSHILLHSSGILIATYGYRNSPDYSIRAMTSSDNGETWEKDIILYKNENSADIGYPSSVELSNGEIMTVFYAHPDEKKHAEILSLKWRL